VSSPHPQPARVRRRRDRAAGIYVHVPFCARQCPYCDFAVDVRRTIPHRAYADALIEEFDKRRGALEGRAMRTIYFGGGTPSLWRADQFGRVLEHLSAALDPSTLVEVCLEANPNDVTEANLAAWMAAGVTRLSIGCQSFQPRLLDALNRNHTPEQALAAVELAIAKGPDIVSLDLIYGNPQQTMQEWRRDLDVVASIEGLSHLSAYHLTIEPGTAFWRRRERGRLTLPDEDDSFEMLERLIDHCERLGIERYEVSNFSRPGCRSRHNTLYWTGAEYLGLGVGAHSLQIEEGSPVARRANPRQTAAYLEGVGRPDEVEHLSAAAHFVERLFLGIRTREGICLDELHHQFDAALEPGWLARAEALLDEMAASGMLERADDRLLPTHQGLNLADALAERIFASFDVDR
jgi:oxygen-independent coproporphyrinogen III oxidase